MGTLDDTARRDLNDEMADLCAKLPIYVVVKVDRAPTDLASDNAPVKRKCNSRNIASEYIKDQIYLNCRKRYEDMIQWSWQLSGCTHKLRRSEIKARKTTTKKPQSGLNGIRTHELCDTGAVLYQLSYEASHWELVSSQY